MGDVYKVQEHVLVGILPGSTAVNEMGSKLCTPELQCFMSKEGSGGVKIKLQGTYFINVFEECLLRKCPDVQKSQVTAKLMTWFRHSMERYRTWPDKPAEKPRVSILHESRQALIVSHNCKRDADVSADADRFAAAEAEALRHRISMSTSSNMFSWAFFEGFGCSRDVHCSSCKKLGRTCLLFICEF